MWPLNRRTTSPWRAPQAQPQGPGEKGFHPDGACVAEPHLRYDGYFTRATIRYPVIRVWSAGA